MNPFFVTDFSISDSLKTVRKSVLIYETIIKFFIFTAPLMEISKIKSLFLPHSICVNIYFSFTFSHIFSPFQSKCECICLI